jgi:hypothetical protein
LIRGDERQPSPLFSSGKIHEGALSRLQAVEAFEHLLASAEVKPLRVAAVPSSPCALTEWIESERLASNTGDLRIGSSGSASTRSRCNSRRELSGWSITCRPSRIIASKT